MDSIGILGGGQLAWMLLEAAAQPNWSVRALAQSPQDPVIRHGYPSPVAPLGDEAALRSFAQEFGCLTFESEFIDPSWLRAAKLASPFFPDLSILERLQSKWSQKLLCRELDLPTATARTVASRDEMHRLQDDFPKGFALKWSQWGYDGKGVHLPGFSPEKTQQFWDEAEKRKISVYAEEFVPYRRELAMVGARDRQGRMVFYPLVETQQTKGVCHWVLGPETDQTLVSNAQGVLQSLLQNLEYVGVLAVEFFETPDGRLLINEMAPRVHNSAHYSQDACAVSQFENHLRAVGGGAVQDPQPRPHFAMLNLLGPQDLSKNLESYLPKQPQHSGLQLHWYKKTETRPGRKLGHVNAVAESAAEHEKNIAALKDFEKKWNHEMRNL